MLKDDKDDNPLTRSNPKGIYTSWTITNNMTFTIFSPIKYTDGELQIMTHSDYS
jgi:hypothetical protein